jgi:hypothetical protein
LTDIVSRAAKIKDRRKHGGEAGQHCHTQTTIGARTCIKACLRRCRKKRGGTGQATGSDLKILCIASTRRLLTSA